MTIDNTLIFCDTNQEKLEILQEMRHGTFEIDLDALRFKQTHKQTHTQYIKYIQYQRRTYTTITFIMLFL